MKMQNLDNIDDDDDDYDPLNQYAATKCVLYIILEI